MRAIIGGNPVVSPTTEEGLYLSSFFVEDELDMDRVYTEMNKMVSNIVTTDDKEMFHHLLETIVACTMFKLDYKLVDMLEPLMIAFKPRLSELLEKSHLFCPCYPYKSGPVDTWTKHHETIEHELDFWKYLIESYREYIETDVGQYTVKELNRKYTLTTRKDHDREEKLKQFYSHIMAH